MSGYHGNVSHCYEQILFPEIYITKNTIRLDFNFSFREFIIAFISSSRRRKSVHYVHISVLIKLFCISAFFLIILLILLMNFIYKSLILYKRKFNRYKIGYFSTINRNTETQADVMFINIYPRYLSFYYSLGANLGSLLHGDVSVMRNIWN